MENAYILGGLRSYVGVVNGMYRHIPAEVLGAEVLKQVMEKYQLREPSEESAHVPCLPVPDPGSPGNLRPHIK